jgi:hypothetical protein
MSHHTWENDSFNWISTGNSTGNYYNTGEAILSHGNVKRQCFIVSVKETANTDGAWFWAITNGRKINILVNHFPMNSRGDNKLTN